MNLLFYTAGWPYVTLSYKFIQSKPVWQQSIYRHKIGKAMTTCILAIFDDHYYSLPGQHIYQGCQATLTTDYMT